ncbi:DUF1707 domain-containing protein [Nocardia puris]|uniref:Uncharacterized protein DUF1707 n=1 Tax=Nocardia puris TaxID=208602 RepID=A0A366DN44_9NOCA|nr:DUF1707 domain-containing protein [Nocardia puris]MBF6213542.1 DUF1707 domain-containing protein [Nocardia puris]MBF6365528.1 DUF1707 domain-containing protein [Nocardia puris]MBF6459994.1 DUF1707 domain-containing protein [Nocardia puris]RBO91523.1 uncharacterized protein DUF1707 [Nocardia puris]
MRARDLDRVRASSLLDAAYAEGQLGAQEYHDRRERAASAKTVEELARLTGDLQVPAGAEDLAPERVATPRRIRARHGYPPHTRARDADRANVVRVLDTAHGDGQLDADEHRAATELAAEARTLGELATLVADLQRVADTAPNKPRSRRPLWFAAGLALAGVLGVVAGYVLAGEDDAPAAPEITVRADLETVAPQVVPYPAPNTVEGIRTFIERYRAKFGDTVVAEARFHETFASAERYAPEGPDWTVDWDYRGGFQRSSSTLTPRREGDTTVDLDTLDLDALGRVLAEAVALTKVPDGRIGYLEFGPDTVWISGRPRPEAVRPVVEISVSNDRSQYGRVYLTPEGEILDIREPS